MTSWKIFSILLLTSLLLAVWEVEGSKDGQRESVVYKLNNGEELLDDDVLKFDVLLGDDDRELKDDDEEMEKMKEEIDEDDDDDDDDDDGEITQFRQKRSVGGRQRRQSGRRRGRGGAGRRRQGGQGAGNRRRGNGRRNQGGNSENDDQQGSDNGNEDEAESAGSDTGMNGVGGNNRRRGRGQRGRGGRRWGGRRGRGRHHGGHHHGRRGGPSDMATLLKDYSESNGRFAVSLYKEMIKDTDNFAISPFSVHSAMAMVMLGTQGAAKQELISGLHVQSPIHLGFQGYNETLDHGENEDATLLLANSVYAKPGFNVRRAYNMKLGRFYGSRLNRFAEENPEQEINAWVAEKTDNMIEEFLDDGEVTDDMKMMLLNAVYFKAMWNEQFDADHTSLQTFTDKDGGTHDVYMMRKQAEYSHSHSEDLRATAIRIPYKGNRYSFTVLLPDYNTELSTVEENLTFEILNTTLASLKDGFISNIQLEMPKFSMDTEAGLKDKLRTLGINHVFEGSMNAFRRMTYHRNIKVNKVKHRCVLEVDEEGTEAAAVTGVTLLAFSLPPTFRLDRPFMFLVRDDDKDMNLFVGRYVNPQGDNMMESE